jgi:hypothetical protein
MWYVKQLILNNVDLIPSMGTMFLFAYFPSLKGTWDSFLRGKMAGV